MKLIGWIALYFMVFEFAQLIVAERLIGVKQIRSNLHPLDGPAPRLFWLSVGWITILLADYMFQAALLLMPMDGAVPDRPYLIRLAALLMLITSFIGFAVRRTCGLKLGLVVMTLEGAPRLGLYLFVFWYLVVLQGVWPDYHFYSF